MVADGYKKTDIGVIPEDWNVKSFQEIFTFLTTATYSRADLTEDGSIQYLHYGDIHTKYDFTLDLDKHELPYISTEQLRKYPLLKDGDIVMADASEDYNGICKSIEVQNLTNKKAIAGLHTFLLRDKNNMLINGFKGYIASSHLLKMQFDRLATGMKVFGVSKGNLLKVQVPIPPKQEQQAIATALSDTDELINSLEKLIAKKKAIKIGTMQELLTGKKRLDGFSGEWEEKTLGDIGEVLMCKRIFSYQTKKSGSIPFYKIGTFGKEADAFISQDLYLSFKTRFSFPKEGDILISASGTIGRTIVYDGKPAYFQDSNIVWIGNNENLVTNKFLYHILQIVKYESEGSTIQRLYNSIIKNTKFILPSKEEQSVITTILTDMDKEIKTLKIKLSKVKAIKEGMMQELLTGKTRLLGKKVS